MSRSLLMRLIPWCVLLLAYIAGMLVDIMEIDATQYAVMARDMLESGDWLHLTDRGEDYLDKPPLVFWASAASFGLFGVNTFAYKLPSVLFALLGVWSTGRLARRLYDPMVGFWAALILASTQGVFVMNNDVKTDMFLIGAVAFSLWMLVAYMADQKWWQLVLGFVGIGVAMLAKGPLGLVIPALALGGHLLLRRDWKNLFRWEWLVGLVIVGIVVLPFCIGLHQQFGPRGVRFFLWTQSFGRVTGESEWANDASPFFLIHTFGWAFLPWTFLAVVALARELRRLGQRLFRLPNVEEGLTVSGFVLIFIAFSLSRFKLPHYIFATFPFAAIFTARYLTQLIDQPLKRRWSTVFQGLHLGFFILGLAVVLFLVFWAFPGPPWWFWVVSALGTMGILAGFFLEKEPLWKHLLPAVIGFAFLNLLVNSYLYPQLLSYQSPAIAGKYITEQGIPPERVRPIYCAGRAMDFYGGEVMQGLGTPADIAREGWLKRNGPPLWIYTNEEGKKQLEGARENYRLVVEQEYEDFRVGKLSLPFLNPELRPKTIDQRYLIRVELP